MSQLIPDRIKHGEMVNVSENEKAPVSTNVFNLFKNVYKFLLSDSPDAKRMRAEYYPIIKAGAAGKATTDEKDVAVKDFLSCEKKIPDLKMAYFNGNYADTYAYTTLRQQTVFNRYLCDAYEDAFTNKKPQLDVLKYVLQVTIYHELAHAFFTGKDSPRELSYQKIVQDLTGMPDAMRLPDNKGESGWFLEYSITGGIIDIVYPEHNAGEEELKYNERKYKDAQKICLRKYEKNVENGSLDCKFYEIKSDALKRHAAGIALSPFKPGEDMVLLPHVDFIKLEATELSAEDLARNKK